MTAKAAPAALATPPTEVLSAAAASVMSARPMVVVMRATGGTFLILRCICIVFLLGVLLRGLWL
jgi:hypothetical protein